MNAIWLLMGLLVLSYIGSFLVGGRALRGFGLPSGAEYVVLGFLLGPFVLGLVDTSTLASFESVANVALGWIALVVGLDFGFVGPRRVPTVRVALGVVMGLLTGAAVAGAAWLVAARMAPGLSFGERAVLALGVGAACAETTHHAILWVAQRHHAVGKISTLVAEIADSDDLAPLLLAGLAFSLAPTATGLWPIPFWGWTIVTAAIGVVLGLIAVVLLGSDFRLIQSWGVLLGTSLLTVGMTARIGLSPMLATFVMGVTIATVSKHREEVAQMVAPSERPVVLPALLLAGAHLHVKADPLLPWLCGAAIGARVLGKLATGLVVRAGSPDARHASPLLGFGLLSSGALAMAVGLAFALRFPGPVGDTVLFVVAVITVFGEFVGPAALRATLRQAGEIAPASEGVRAPSSAPGAAPGDGDAPPPPDAGDPLGTPIPPARRSE